jgi:hypothetical protein
LCWCLMYAVYAVCAPVCMYVRTFYAHARAVCIPVCTL